jgi:protein gp37
MAQFFSDFDDECVWFWRDYFIVNCRYLPGNPAFINEISEWNPEPRLWPFPNIQIGVSSENQKAADERIPLLLECPAAVRFVSCEPLLEEIDLRQWLVSFFNPATTRLDWVIVGGESGPGARPMHPDWARSLRAQCQDAGVVFFMKQMGSAWAKLHGCRDSHGGDMSEWPEDLRVREYPEPRRC